MTCAKPPTALDCPWACCRGILDVALKTCREGDKVLTPAACEALAEAFERCPDALLAQLQPHLLDLSSLVLDPQEPSPAGSPLQQALIALFVAYVQSCADSIVLGGRSEALRALFAVSHVAKEAAREGTVEAHTHAHEFAAAHVVDAIAAVGRALLKAAQDDGAVGLGSGGAGVAGSDVSAELQGMMQVYLEGVVGLLPLHQVLPWLCFH